MGLFNRKPKWQHKDWKKRLEAVNKLDDQEILIEIAKNDSNEDVRNAAIKKIDLSQINDNSFLIELAKNNSNRQVRIDAIRKIDDESVLKDIAKNDSEYYGIGYNRAMDTYYASTFYPIRAAAVMRIWELKGEENVYSENISDTKNILYLANIIDGKVSIATPENPKDSPSIEQAKERFRDIRPGCVTGL